MTAPPTYHGTAVEIAFMKGLGARGRLTRLRMLQNYRTACHIRANWGQIDRHAVLQATDREIEAEMKKALRRTA